MAEAKSELFSKASTLARDVYLANLGIASTAYEQGQDFFKQTEDKIKETEAKAKDLYAKRNEIFESFVSRGEKLQSEALSFYEERRAKAKSKLEELKSESNAAVEERLKDLRGSFDKVKGSVSRKAEKTKEVVAE